MLTNKTLYRIEVYMLKIIPMILSGVMLLNTILSFFYIETPILSYIGGVSLLPLIFLYISSYAFKFCLYHRLFLHYISLNWILNIIDYYIGIPVSNKTLFLGYIIITGTFLYAIVYFKIKNNSREKKRGSHKDFPRDNKQQQF